MRIKVLVLGAPARRSGMHGWNARIGIRQRDGNGDTLRPPQLHSLLRWLTGDLDTVLVR